MFQDIAGRQSDNVQFDSISSVTQKPLLFTTAVHFPLVILKMDEDAVLQVLKAGTRSVRSLNIGEEGSIASSSH